MNYVMHPHEIIFSGKIRSFVLRHVLKHTDLTDRIENLPALRRIKGREYTCACPWCGAEEGFSLNKRTGDCSCSTCGKTGDLVDLLQSYTNESMDCILGRFEYILEQGGEI